MTTLYIALYQFVNRIFRIMHKKDFWIHLEPYSTKRFKEFKFFEFFYFSVTIQRTLFNKNKKNCFIEDRIFFTIGEEY